MPHLLASSQLPVQGDASVAQITTIAITVVFGVFVVVKFAPASQALAATVPSANVIFKEISRRSQDSFDPSDVAVEDFLGNIELHGLPEASRFPGCGLVSPSADLP